MRLSLTQALWQGRPLLERFPLHPTGMNAKATAFWFVIAAALFSFIFFYQRQARKAQTGPGPILPGLKASAITCVEVLPQKREPEIRACRTNQGWQLVAPLTYPAQSISVENLLTTLEHLTPSTFINEAELKHRSSADEEYGFTSPQCSIILQPGNYRIRIGKKTSPGDQVFLRSEGVV